MSQTRTQIEQEGYCVVKGLLTVEEVNECKKEIRNIIEKWYETYEQNGSKEGNDWEELCNRLPSIKDGTQPMPSDKEKSIRRLFRMAVHTDYFRKLAQHPKVEMLVQGGMATVLIVVCRSSHTASSTSVRM